MTNFVPLPPNAQLKNGRYVVRSFLTAGGFGAVYVAEDALMQGRLCVLKESFDQTSEGRAQFEVEAATLSVLSHPNLVRVTDNFVETNKKTYLVMDYVEGEDLEEMLKRAPCGLPEKQALGWMDQILDAVAYCHAFNPRVIHRDIKPANIRIRKSDGVAVLVDFGIAKIGGGLTRAAARGYSPGYAPPEQYGKGTDTYSDVYALGATLYHLLTGRVPPESVDIAHSGAVLPSPRSLNPAISAQTEQLIEKAMQLNSKDRFCTAADMRLAFQGKLPTPPAGATCAYCGVQVRAGARFCPVCGKSTATIQPFVFRKANQQAMTLADLVHLSDSFWDEACELFWRGEFEPWLDTIGEQALSQSGAAIRTRHSDRGAALEDFLETAAPSRSRPILAAGPVPLDLGRLYKGDTRVMTLTVTNTGRGYLHGVIAVDPPAWLAVHPASFGCLAGAQQPVQVEANTAGLSGDELGTGYSGRVVVQSNRGSQTIDVRLVVVDPPETAVTPAQLDFGMLPFGTRASQALQISNKGGGTLNAVVRLMEPWLMLLDPAGQPAGSPVSSSFALRRGHSTVVNLAVDSGRLPARGRHCGVFQIEASNARTPITAVQVHVSVDLPYLLDPADRGSEIRDKDWLWRWCDGHWDTAIARLADGRLAACLSFIGESTLAQEAVLCQQKPDRCVGLEKLLRACGAPAPAKYDTNALKIERLMGFGFLPKCGKKPPVVTFEIRNNDVRGYFHGHLEPVAPWITIPQPQFGCLPGAIAEVQIHADHAARPRNPFSPGETLFDIVPE